MGLFHGLFTTPSWQSLALLAQGWALATDHHTIPTSLWLTGATAMKHCAQFYVFLGCPLYSKRSYLDCVAEQVPGRRIRSLADGGYATKDYVRQLPEAIHVVGRFPIRAKLYEVPPPPNGQASRGSTQKRRPDRLTQDPHADRRGMGTSLRRSAH
jgi:hypothetical protein